MKLESFLVAVIVLLSVCFSVRERSYRKEGAQRVAVAEQTARDFALKYARSRVSLEKAQETTASVIAHYDSLRQAVRYVRVLSKDRAPTFNSDSLLSKDSVTVAIVDSAFIVAADSLRNEAERLRTESILFAAIADSTIQAKDHAYEVLKSQPKPSRLPYFLAGVALGAVAVGVLK